MNSILMLKYVHNSDNSTICVGIDAEHLEYQYHSLGFQVQDKRVNFHRPPVLHWTKFRYNARLQIFFTKEMQEEYFVIQGNDNQVLFQRQGTLGRWYSKRPIQFDVKYCVELKA